METLTIKKLFKKYKKRYVVNNINLKINSGEIIGLFGPNGSGKTTTFRMILGIIQNNPDNVLINNKDISMLPTYLRSRLGIGYLPQDCSIFQKLTVFNNLMAILQIKNHLTKYQKNKIVIKIMNHFHIRHLYNNLGNTLSGGERKKVEIARMLITNPKFVLLDEPFSGVDPITIIDIKQTIQYLKNKKIGILITDHNVKETLCICDKAYILYQGKTIAQGSPSEILKDKNVRKIYLGNTFQL